jgi:tetratricopeptide (TPR) repeat protein
MSLAEAERLLLHDRLEEARDLLVSISRGAGPEARRAKIEAGRLAVRTGDIVRALEWFRDAWGTPDDSTDGDRQVRSEAARYLGELLERAGEYLQAEAVLRGAMESRLADTSADDPEYGALAVSLAAVLLALNKRGEAKMLAEVAARSLWEAGDERAVEGLLVRAMAIKATQGRHYDALEPVYGLPPETQDLLLREAVVGQRHRARFLLPVLFELDHWHKAQRGGISHPQILALIAELARDLGRSRDRIRALETLALYFLQASEPELHGHAIVALARAHHEAGRTPAAVALLLESAEQHQELASALLCEAGALSGDPDVLRKAIDVGEPAAAARAHTALGCLLVHREEPGAVEHLEEGSRLPSPDPDAQLARLHLIAQREGLSCGCGESAAVMSRALQEELFAAVPGDLVFVVGVLGTDDGREVRLELAREPKPEERATIDRVIADVRERFERQPGA